MESFFNPEYSEEFDEFLYMLVGYPVLTTLTNNLFVSPYGATSLREYFANAFEEYFGRSNFRTVKLISPAISDKIEMLLGK
jgi:multisubunit Na+/H+ antiporter MnhB subunit